MKFISHRGNLDGKKKERENSLQYILTALSLGYDVEIDVIVGSDNLVYLGHDKPQYDFDHALLSKHKNSLWCHAKNLDALKFLLQKGYNAFYHTDEDFVLTSENNIWAFPGNESEGTICVCPESQGYSFETIKKMGCCGICSDYIKYFRER